MSDDDDAIPADLSPAHRRALWIVALLNAGYGIIQLSAGFVAESQSLKSDAVDFLGDGLFTFLGLVLAHWSPRRRSQAALIQGASLAALGLAVLGSTAYRVVVQQQPDAGLMGAFGAGALVVNVAAAIVLVPHRKGDASARAVWLFTRNDAIGNAAVIAGAGLVAWTQTPWPDLVVAVAVAGLFLWSSVSIVRKARAELHRHRLAERSA